MAKLIDELLDAKRFAMNPIKLRLEMIDLETLILSTLETYAEELTNNNIQVNLHLQKNVCCLLDPIKMRQAFGYLISNAIKYGLNKPIEISISQNSQEFVHIRVKDQGLGISKHDQERVFQPFNRAISYVEVSGFGLGLYIAKQIFDAHHIEISIESNIRQGSTVHLTIKKTANKEPLDFL
jgi:signal transduction histidine kinase